MKKQIENRYQEAKERYAAWGVDTEWALQQLEKTPLSLHCWQADDVGGFEHPDAALEGGGIQITGQYPGKPKNIEQLRQDLARVFSLIPGRHRLNLHASYGDFGKKSKDRDEIETAHFQSWIDWAKELGIGLDFNSTFFSHPLAASGFTLSSPDETIRHFWIRHAKRCRSISNDIGKALATPCVHNLWIPDGAKDITVDRFRHRSLLKQSLDEIFAEHYPEAHMVDALESKLFGIGSESFVVGSHEFYLGYALQNNKMLCIDIGHFHPTESCADKVSALFQYFDRLLFHITRSIRWDSDHVVVLDDVVRALMQEIVWSGKLEHTRLALDFFDASINRIGAYVIGARATQKALLLALLDPIAKLREYEREGRYFERLALLEDAKSMPFGAVWDYFCLLHEVPPGVEWIDEVRKYEKQVLGKR